MCTTCAYYEMNIYLPIQLTVVLSPRPSMVMWPHPLAPQSVMWPSTRVMRDWF